jgi:hypothetical protein
VSFLVAVLELGLTHYPLSKEVALDPIVL